MRRGEELTRSFVWVTQLSGADAVYVGKLYQAADALSDPKLEKFPEPTRRSAIGTFPRSWCWWCWLG